MKFFVIGLPHTKTLDRTVDPTFSTCAFTTKIWYLCRMMYERGHEVIHLGNEGSNPLCTRHISVGDPILWEQNYGKRKPTEMYNTSQNAYTQLFYQNARKAILENMGPNNSSIICLPFGVWQKSATEGVPQLVVESGIGYADSFADCRVFESYTWMMYTMGRQLKLWEGGKWYWSVIPNGTDPDVYGPVEEKKENYFLLLCRLNLDKGVEIACQTSRAVGTTIKIIGQGDPSRYLGPGVEYYPPMNPKEFVPIMRKARGLFSPTIYPEPFGCTHVEAMMCGCPVITTDWAVYCVPTEAKILTKRGWLNKEQIILGEDETLGYDKAIDGTRWTLITKINSFSKQQTTEYSNRKCKIRVTKGHKWSAIRIQGSNRKEVLAPIEELCGNSDNRIRLAAIACDGDLKTTPQQAALIAWLLTDGSIRSREYNKKTYRFDPELNSGEIIGKATIWQSKPTGLEKIRKVLTGLSYLERNRKRTDGEPGSFRNNFPPKYFIINPAIVRQAFISGEINKRGLSGFVLGLSKEARFAFLEACFDAEGWKATKNSTRQISQNEGVLCEAMCLCTYLCGKRPTIQERGGKGRVISLCNPMIAPTRLHRKEGKIEDVWCPTTELGTWTMLIDNNIVLTGNSETVQHGKTGYRCRTRDHFVWAAKNINKIDPKVCREYAIKNYGLDKVGSMYEEYFQQVMNLKTPEGWETPNPGRTQLDWLNRDYSMFYR